MPDLVWNDVAHYFEVDGSLRDAYVFGVSMVDWQHVVDVARARGWRLDYTADGLPLPLPQKVSDIFTGREETGTTLSIWPVADIAVNTHFFADDEIEFDFDPQELQGQDRLDVLCAFLRAMGSALNKPVVFTPENNPNRPLLTYIPSSDRVTAMPGSTAEQGTALHA
ncbi:hypothetical protein Ais01nite_42740 [Asanoa ishikariensis]|uniref:Uncharacterized protein n=1 Tax=Asanoa ishikariensis TaxID=137265 RepID=A0A1H3MMW8_9ACTN|nr:hypothetical protein [Asanoa ishikariensis]GIF66239.1 hypothetical protein Ais01nite_42740 [Asanoa ishikariensis]SDY78072.1 hypothetical protein SAMN05421684_1514 [Asanoa ishikariensis]